MFCNPRALLTMLAPMPLAVIPLAVASPALAAQQRGAADDDRPAAWSNETELSVVRTQGNAETQTFGFKNTLRRHWPSTRMRIRIDGVRARTSGEQVLVVAPGLRFPPGARPERAATHVEQIDGAPDVEQYFVEALVERTISDRFFWNAGTSWDRNRDAGIRNRYIAFGGVGNVWTEQADGGGVAFSTAYGVSYTARDETEPDPARAGRFAGVRIDSDYHQRLGAAVELDSDATLNVNLPAASDYSLNLTNAVGVAISEHLALRVSLQHLYEHEPAVADVGIVARVALIDPDGAPGSGDELFETVADGGATIAFGTGPIRKNRLDVILRTALVVTF